MKKEKLLLQWLRICDLVGYCLLIVFALYNMVAFILLQGKARNALVVVFYVLALTMCICSIVVQIHEYRFYSKDHTRAKHPYPWILDIVSDWARATLGLF